MIAVLATGEYTLRQLLFPFATAAVLFWGESLQEKRGPFWTAIFFFSLPMLSLFIAHWLAPNVLRFWELGTFLAYMTAISVLTSSVVAFLPARLLRIIVSCVVAALTVSAAMLVWGHVLAENAWPNADAVFAIIQSNPKESLSYVRDTLGARAVIALIIAAVAVAAASWAGGRLRGRAVSKKMAISCALLAVACIAGINRTRENIMTIPVYEVKGYVARIEEFKKERAEREAGRVSFSLSAEEKQGGLFILVIGESATRDHLSAFGYGRETTPWMDSMKGKDECFFFDNAYACYTTTAPVIAKSMTAENQYSTLDFARAPSLLEVAKAAGYHTTWLSNQVRYSAWDNLNTVIAEGADVHIWTNSHLGETLISDYTDGVLVDKLRELPKDGDRLIVIHLMGSHNSYQDRYPGEFARFSGGKQTVDEYDGSILYTDYVLQKIYEEASALPNFQGMIYFSDHGEGVDHGRFHGTSHFIWQMARIPLFIVVSPSYAAARPSVCARLREHSHSTFTNDLIFDLMLGMMGLKAEEISEDRNNLTSAGYDENRERFMTLNGKKYISEDDGE